MNNTPAPANETYRKHIANEQQRILGRRRIAVPRPEAEQERTWALSLSGGGIRSATFSLGVLQALAEAPLPPGFGTGAIAPTNAQAEGEAAKQWQDHGLLAQFDYLATVSGGGYIGTFFCSQFIPGRALDGGAQEAAKHAYETLRSDPPGRLRSQQVDARRSAFNAMAWLRENGRYLAPSSAGDLLYGATIALRAWFGMQFVVGTMVLVVLILLALLKTGLAYGAHEKFNTLFTWVEGWSTPSALFDCMWVSSLWVLPALVILLVVVPCAVGFWMTYPPRRRDQKNAAPHSGEHQSINDTANQSLQFWAGFGTAVALIASLGIAAAALYGWRAPIGWVAEVITAAMAAGAVWFLITKPNQSFASLRVHLTRQLTSSLKLTAVLATVALIDSAAQTAYSLQHSAAAPITLTGMLIWLTKQAAPLLNKVGQTKKFRLPLETLAALGGLGLALLLVFLWDFAIIWLQWGMGDAMSYGQLGGEELGRQIRTLGIALAIALILMLLAGQYPDFLNLSSLQGLYSARLTRAYQGASNKVRFQSASQAAREKLLSSAEPEASDHVSYARYNENPLAPLHIINVCLNQNVDPAEQLIQRDRKGRPLTILPGLQGAESKLAFAIDGNMPDQCEPEQLSIGEWIGVSGAAVSTGLGRSTSAGMALLIGLSNVRTGRWWRSGVQRGKTMPPGLFRAAFPTQAYLLDELTAHFYGTRRPLHYLTDGGHFENTAMYELLRPERRVKLAVVCDCGTDVDYAFGDLANLVRLARIDFGLDIIVDQRVTSSFSQLRSVFGTTQELASPQAGSNKCALLLNVYKRGDRSQPVMRIVLVKPVVVAAAPVDVHNYHKLYSEFPQQTTGDQFFDEAQWESYRKLGLEIGRLIFNSGNAEFNRELWGNLLGAVHPS